MKPWFKKQGAPASAPDVDQGPLSVFSDEPSEPAAKRHDVIDAETVEIVREVRDDDAPFGPELADHLVAPRERRRRRIRFGGLARPVETVQQADTSETNSATEGSPGVDVAGSTDDQPAASVEASQTLGLGAKLRSLGRSRKSPAGPVRNHPIRVLIGFLAEVSEKDAIAYALGVADKHVENIERAYYDVFQHANGFAYEVHEGGTGNAFLPDVLKYFESHGPYRSEGDVRVHIPTALRTVEVTRKDQGLESVLLPESAPTPTSREAVAGPSMRLALNKRDGLLVAGAAVFITGFFAALIIGSFMRIVPVSEVSAPRAEELKLSDLPAGQWSTQLQSVPEGKYVKALRYDKSKGWSTETGDVAPAENLPTN